MVDGNFKLSVSIMSHVSRAEQLARLEDQIGDQIEYQVSLDPGDLGLWNNAKRAWANYSPDATHHMVLQDDVLLSKNFFFVAQKLINQVTPGDSVSFCDNIVAEMNLAEQNGYHWITTTKVRHAQCIVQPVSQIQDWIHFSDWFFRPEYDYDDGRLEVYLYKNKRAIWHSVPSLVEHDDQGSVAGEPNDIPSTGYKFVGINGEAEYKEWRNLNVGFRPANLRLIEKWSIGEVQQINPSDYPSIGIFQLPTSGLSYNEVIEQARADRGITKPYVYQREHPSSALGRPCGDENPCD